MNIWLAIVNPNAGNSRSMIRWKKIQILLKSENIPYVPIYTEKLSETINKTIDAIHKGFRKLLIVGGDGILNEVNYLRLKS